MISPTERDNDMICRLVESTAHAAEAVHLGVRVGNPSVGLDGGPNTTQVGRSSYVTGAGSA